MQRKHVCPEYLGDIDAELLLQNLTNTNPYRSTIGPLRESMRNGRFTVSAEYELEDLSREEAARRAVEGLRANRRLVRIVLEAGE